MSIGSLVGNLVAFAGSTVLARVYSPTEHGQYAVILAIGVILTPVISGRFEQAIVIPRQDRDAFHLLSFSLRWASCVAAVLTLTFWALSAAFGTYLNSAVPSQLLWLAPVLGLLTAYLNLLNQYNVRLRRFGAVAARNAVYPASMTAGQLGLGAFSMGAFGLSVGAASGRLATVLLFLRGYLENRRQYIVPQWSQCKAILSRYRKFPMVLTFSAMINSAGLQMPVLLVGVWYGDSSAGLFSMSQRTLSIPLILIGAAIGQVYLAEMSRAMHESPARALKLFTQSSTALSLAGLAIFALLLALGPSAFSLVFGEEWRTSGEIARAMGISLSLQLIASPLSQVLIVYEKHWMQLSWDLLRLLVVTVALAVPWLLGLSLVTSIWFLSAGMGACYVVLWALSRCVLVKATRVDS